MTGSRESDHSDPPTARARWPEVIGTIGIILGTLIVIDKLDDLLLYSRWSEQDWRRFVGPGLAAMIVRASPPLFFQVVSGLAEIGLGVLLFVGSLALRRHRRSGIRLCRAWAWLAVVWAVVAMSGVWWWLRLVADQILPPGMGEFAVLGVAFGLALMLLFPLFLLIWFSRPAIRAEYEAWPA